MKKTGWIYVGLESQVVGGVRHWRVIWRQGRRFWTVHCSTWAEAAAARRCPPSTSGGAS